MLVEKKISVIIPVFNVSAFIEKCTLSLMTQTIKEDIEYIFVNDASEDDSVDKIIKVIEHFPERQNQIRIINHINNKGLPSARNTGLKEATGVYIYHCDSDDYVEPNMLEEMLNKAEENNADMVWCDWYLSFESNERLMKQPDTQSSRQALRYMLDGSLKYNVWNKIIKHSIYKENDIVFPEGYTMGEDMTIIKLISHCTSVAHVNRPLYHYIRTNSNAISHHYNEIKLNSLLHNVDEIIKYLNKHVIDTDITQEISWFLLNTKLPFLLTGRPDDIKIWRSLFPSSNSEIFSNKNLSVRVRLLQKAAQLGLDWINLLYYRMVQKIIYGKIYK